MTSTNQPKFKNPEVFAVFQDYPHEIKSKLLFLRNLIFEVAKKANGVGELEETLKWGQPLLDNPDIRIFPSTSHHQVEVSTVISRLYPNSILATAIL